MTSTCPIFSLYLFYNKDCQENNERLKQSLKKSILYHILAKVSSFFNRLIPVILFCYNFMFLTNAKKIATKKKFDHFCRIL